MTYKVAAARCVLAFLLTTIALNACLVFVLFRDSVEVRFTGTFGKPNEAIAQNVNGTSQTNSVREMNEQRAPMVMDENVENIKEERVAMVDQDAHHNNNEPRMFALMTEPRCIDAVPFVLTNALEMLPQSYPVVYIHANGNAECVKRWLVENPSLAEAAKSGRLVHFVDSHMDRKIQFSPHARNNWNNVMFTNITFWESLKVYGDTVITIQADTLICSKGDLPSHWKNANYLGGPSQARLMQNPSRNETNTYHLNGGLSLRNLDWVVRCLKNYTGKPGGEDTVFNTCEDGAKVASIYDAMSFSSDCGFTMCFNHWNEKGRRVCPWGVHKPWNLGRSRGPPIRELVLYCPDIQTLSDKLGKNENLTAKYCFGTRCM